MIIEKGTFNPMSIYYRVKPFIPRYFQILIRRQWIRMKLMNHKHTWPIDPVSESPPPCWSGWPDDKQFAIVLTHDVDTMKGQERCRDLMALEMKTGFRSSFNFVPERYTVSPELRHLLTANGFEIGVHGLNHDGKLYSSFETFRDRAKRINCYIRDWNAVGFRSPSMHHNLEWIHLLNIDYDSSTFDTDPFEPQSDGVRTIFPFLVESINNKGYVEMPYTIPQDFTLFVLLREKTISIWKKKLDWIAEKGGMALVNTHPDYMDFTGINNHFEEYPSSHYKDFLEYIISQYTGKYWNPLPRDLATYYLDEFKNP